MRPAPLLFAALVACNDKPAKDTNVPPPTTATVTATVTATSSASLPPSAPPTASSSSTPADEPPPDAGKTSPVGAKCKVDTDCELFSSYCSDAPCMCFPMGKGAGQPKCRTDRPVNCLVDPCQQKLAKCKDGACAAAAKNDR